MEVTANVKYLPASTTQYIVDGNDGIINVDTSLNAVTIILPNINNSGFSNSSKGFIINDITESAATNNITVAAAGNTVNSQASVLITSNGGTAKASVASLTEWFVETQPSSSVSELMVSITYAALATLITGNLLIEGLSYKITNRADAGIIVKAVSSNKISLEGKGIFLNPDFQGIGEYGGIKTLTGIDAGSILGVWSGAASLNGTIVFWNGLHYVVTNNLLFNGSNPSLNLTAYTLLPKFTIYGYIREVDFIHYDFDIDAIIYRADKRGNKISGSDIISGFQWGNNNTYGNLLDTVTYSYIDIINQRGVFEQNTIISGAQIYITNDFIGSFSTNILSNRVYVEVHGNIIISACVFSIYMNIILEYTAEKKRIESGFSNFKANLDVAAAAIYNGGGILMLPTNLSYIGKFIIINNSGYTFDTITNMPTNHESEFTVQAGNSHNFSHESIATATANQLVSDAALSNSIVGRVNGSDSITYARRGNLNVRTNIVKLA